MKNILKNILSDFIINLDIYLISYHLTKETSKYYDETFSFLQLQRLKVQRAQLKIDLSFFLTKDIFDVIKLTIDNL